MFSSVGLPGLFVLRRLWRSPCTSVWTMWWLWTDAPLSWVMARSSRFIGLFLRSGCLWARVLPGAAGPPRGERVVSLREVGRDLDLAGDDLRLEGVDLGHEGRVDLALEVVERRDADATVGEGADVRVERE